MALTPGTGGGDYMEPNEWIALGEEGALVAVIVRAHGTVHMTKGASAGKDLDRVDFDLYVLDGARKGEVMPSQDAIGRGIVAPLKRVAVGEEVAYRVAVGTHGSTRYPQLNAPGDLPQEAVDLFEELKTSGGSAPTSSTKEKATAGATASSNGSKPAEPDF